MVQECEAGSVLPGCLGLSESIITLPNLKGLKWAGNVKTVNFLQSPELDIKITKSCWRAVKEPKNITDRHMTPPPVPVATSQRTAAAAGKIDPSEISHTHPITHASPGVLILPLLVRMQHWTNEWSCFLSHLQMGIVIAPTALSGQFSGFG